STTVRRAGRKPASVSATVLTAKNSRLVAAFAISDLRLGVFWILRVLARRGAATIHAGHAEHGPERDLAEAADRRLAERLLELRGAEEVRRCAAGLDGADLAAAGHATRELDQVARGRAGAHAVHVRPLDVARDSEELKTRRALDALLLPPLRAALEDDRD